MRKSEYKKVVGRIAKLEGGKSQAKMGDVMQIVNHVFDRIYTDTDFLIDGLIAAQKRRYRSK